jgi:hypothetical protein
MAKRIDLAGHVFGYLTAVSIAERGAGGATWLCRCKCGNEKIIRLSSLRSGTTKSCGCLRNEKLENARANKLTKPKKSVQKTENTQPAFNKPSLKQCETPAAAQPQPKKLADEGGIKIDKSKAGIKQRLDMCGFNREMANIEKSLYAWD